MSKLRIPTAAATGNGCGSEGVIRGEAAGGAFLWALSQKYLQMTTWRWEGFQLLGRLLQNTVRKLSILKKRNCKKMKLWMQCRLWLVFIWFMQTLQVSYWLGVNQGRGMFCTLPFWLTSIYFALPRSPEHIFFENISKRMISFIRDGGRKIDEHNDRHSFLAPAPALVSITQVGLSSPVCSAVISLLKRY